MVMGWCTTAEAVVYERARPLKQAEEGGSGGKQVEEAGSSSDGLSAGKAAEVA